MNAILNLLKGVVIGIANIIPGVSGGTMAVSLGIFDRLIFAVNDLRKHPAKSLKFLLPLLVGMASGIIGFTYAVEFLLREYALPTCMAFIGLIAGGVPMLVGEYRQSLRKAKRKVTVVDAVVFLAMLLLVVCMPFFQQSKNAVTVFGVGALTLGSLFVVGVVASATMVIPGISGSLVMMILGYYHGIIGTLKSFFEAVRGMDFSGAMRYGFPLLFFGIGVIVGIFAVAKLLKFLFERLACTTYSGILGLVAASPVAILYNTGALSDLQLGGAVLRVLCGVVLLAGCAVFTYFFSKLKTD